MKTLKYFLCLAGLLLAPRFASANLTGPYTADANTLVLLHFDEAAGGSATANAGSLGSSFYSINYPSASYSTVTTMLGGVSYTNVGAAVGFNLCSTNPSGNDYLWGYDYNKDGQFEPDTGGNTSVDFMPMSGLNIGNGGQTPFTLEAIIQPTGGTANNQEIICTDSSAGNRGFQFRIGSGTLQFTFVQNSAALSATIPTTGNDAYVSGNWYHVAFTYDGTYGTLYWTLLNPTNGAAHQIGSTTPLTLGTTQGAVTGPLIVGNRGRRYGTETFVGSIDEVRISNVARTSGQMQFYSPQVTISPDPVSQNIDYNQPVTFSVGASSQFPLFYQWTFNSNSIPNATNTSYTIANAAAGNGGYYACVVTNTIGYAATSSPALLVVGAANFLAHRYSFTNGTVDSIAGANGTNFGDANVTGGNLVLDGTTGTFMQLPGNLFNSGNSTALTMEWWASYGTNPTNVYTFAFGYTNYVLSLGIVGVQYADYSSHVASGQLLSSSANNPQLAQSTTPSGNLDGQYVHVACVIDPPDQILSIYTNGVLEAVNTNFTVGLASVSDQLSYIGASLAAGDPYLKANIKEMRMFLGALSGISIQQSQNLGPGQVLSSGPAQFITQPASTSLIAGLTASFTALANGYLPISYQWFKNGVLVPGATNTTYSFVVSNTDNNATIVCEATNTIGVTTYVTNSATATVTVLVPQPLRWAGVNGANWDTSTLNWSNATPALVSYGQWDLPTFDDSGAARQSTVNLQQALNVTGMVVSNNAYNYVLQSSGQNGSLNGQAVALVKTGTGSLTLDVTNNCTGSTLIANGVLQIGNADGSGGLNNGPVTNNASLVLDLTNATVLPSPISGSGSMTMAGSGTVTASGSNSYTGATFINNGITYLANATGLGATNGGISVASGAELYITANVDIGVKPLTLAGSGVSSAGALRKGGAGVTGYYGPITMTGNSILSVDSNATLNLTNSAGLSATGNANLTLAGSGAGNIAGPLSLGSGTLTVSGGRWTVAANNSYSGLTTISGGALRIPAASSLGPAPGSFNASQITLSGGALEAATSLSLNDGNRGITVSPSGTLTVDTNATFTEANDISGSGTATLTKSGPGTLVLSGANDFMGVLDIDTASGTANDGTTVIANNAAIGNLLVLQGLPSIFIQDLNAGSSTLALNGSGGGITVAPDIQLAGRDNFVPAIDNVAGNNTISGYFELTVGGQYVFQSDSGTLTFSQAWPYQPPAGVTSARNLFAAGAGTITMSGGVQDTAFGNTNVPVNVYMIGSGQLNLPAANAYSGTTVVSNGVLSLTGSIGTNTVTVNGGLLVGTGAIGGPVTVLPGGAIEAGSTTAIGTLNLSQPLALSGNTIVKINGTSDISDQFSGQTSVAYGGTLTVTNVGGPVTRGESFTVFTPGTFAGNFGFIVGSPGPGLQYSFANGVLSVVTGPPSTPTNIVLQVTGNQLTVSWPQNYTGWGLQAQTNSLNAGLSTNWVNVPFAYLTNEMIFTANPTNGSVFYRMAH